jgi:hypothetical protein
MRTSVDTYFKYQLGYYDSYNYNYHNGHEDKGEDYNELGMSIESIEENIANIAEAIRSAK